jgi:hypothetical protein
VRLRIAALVVVLAAPAHADDDEAPPRRFHGSIAAGGSLLLTGDRGDSTRLDAALSLQPWRRFGAVLAVRALGAEPVSMMLTGGIEYQAAASRPRLVLALYADAGVETGGTDAVVGVGVRTTFVAFGPVGVVLDSGFHFVADPDDARLVIGSALMLALVR